MNFGDTIEIKGCGKYRILGPNDVIQAGDITTVSFLNNEPMCYSETLKKFKDVKNMKNIFLTTQAIGDTPSNNHTTRIYLRPLKY